MNAQHLEYVASERDRKSLSMDGTRISEIIEQFPTPFYLYSADSLREPFNRYSAGLASLNHLICYAVKANPNLAVLALLRQLGSGADVVSRGEGLRALTAGITGDCITFSGAGKRDDELDFAIDEGFLINVETPDELTRLTAIARRKKTIARTSFRICPNIDGKTLEKITTGNDENKFGVNISDLPSLYAAASSEKYLRPEGLSCHVGSMIEESDIYARTFELMVDLVLQLRSAGDAVSCLNLGGGLFYNYTANISPNELEENEFGGNQIDESDKSGKRLDIERYCEQVVQSTKNLDVKVIIEPGRSLVAQGGICVTKVTSRQLRSDRKILILDIGMNDLVRPALYGAEHGVQSVSAIDGAKIERYDIAGPICESSDTFARNVALRETKSGDFFVIRDTGAYGASMSSTYNSRPLIQELLLDDGEISVIRRKQSAAEMLELETIPSKLAMPT